jgi:hypothetical protein
MYQLVFYVPESHKEIVKNALFSVGAGSYKNYDLCSFETEGVGQFRPLDGSNPYIGAFDKIEKVKEYRVEMIVRDEIVKETLDTLINTHPYEEVAYSIWRLIQKDDLLQ